MSFKPDPLDKSTVQRFAAEVGTNECTVEMFDAAIVRLASDAEDQIRTKPEDYCLACDLINDHEDASITHVAHKLPVELKRLWEAIRTALNHLSEDDLEHDNDEVVHRPAWNEIRALSREMLSRFRALAIQPKIEWTEEPADMVAEIRRIVGASDRKNP